MKRIRLDHYTLCAADHFEVPYASVTKEMRALMKGWLFSISYGGTIPYGMTILPTTKDILTIKHLN